MQRLESIKERLTSEVGQTVLSASDRLMDSQKVAMLEAEEEQLTGMVWTLEKVCGAALRDIEACHIHERPGRSDRVRQGKGETIGR